jgi:hypothetical protein
LVENGVQSSRLDSALTGDEGNMSHLASPYPGASDVAAALPFRFDAD